MPKSVPADLDDDERPPLPDDIDAPPALEEELPPPRNDAPVGFWSDIVSAAKKELKPPAVGFFSTTPDSLIKGILQGDKLILECSNGFVLEAVNKPQILAVVAQKASAKLGRPIRVVPTDKNANPRNNAHMEQLLQFGRDHSDIIKLKDNG